MSRRGGGFLVSLSCLILFIYVFMHEEDPYFVYDNIAVNIAGFSQLTASTAKFSRWLLNSMESVRGFVAKVSDYIITVPFANILDAIFGWLMTNPVTWFIDTTKKFDQLFDALGWFK